MSDLVSTTATPTSVESRPATDEAVQQQAMGVLMYWYDIPPLEAVVLLEGWAVHCDVSTSHLAEALAHGICLGKAGGVAVTVRRTRRRPSRMANSFPTVRRR